MAAPPPKDAKLNDPYCTNCGYLLVGATAAAECPECGRPLVDVLARHVPTNLAGIRSIRRRSTATVFGWPLWDIAYGPDPATGQRIGRARGVIALGDQAFGGIAIGGMSVGIVALGGVNIGIGAAGGVALGAASAAGGVAIGGISAGGCAVGGLSTGGMAVGVVAQGGMAVGVYARGGGAIGTHVISPRAAADPKATEMFKKVAPIMGASPPAAVLGGLAALRPVVAVLGIDLLLAAAVALTGIVMARRRDPLAGHAK
ncbi:MAG: hypothetical protein IT438_11280 [Phycisphaerales bacterium]|nr:hypothetical protein [Phycisphaerales bacterium]